MSRKIPKIKGIQNNSKIIAIGSLKKRAEHSAWRINVQVQPDHKDLSFGVSQIPLLARRRMLNATQRTDVAGFSMNLLLNKVEWKSVMIKECPIPGVAQYRDSEQWCFYFDHLNTKVFLPQLELARVLFLYEPYLCRLAMIERGLAQEFDIKPLDDPNSIQINILDSCTLPKHIRGDYELRRALASVILDPDMRKSFESIARYEKIDGLDKTGYRFFKFRFDPPPLDQVTLSVRGHYDESINAIFVYEIHGVRGLRYNHPRNVHFFDPDFKKAIPAPGKPRQVNPNERKQPQINDQDPLKPQTANEWVLDSPQVMRTFIDPAHTTRNGTDQLRPYGSKEEKDDDEGDTNSREQEVSTDEASRLGQIPTAGIDGLDDQSDDAHNYADRFHAFAAMVEILQRKGCLKENHFLRKFPAIAGRSKHLLDDGNPRLWSVHLLNLKSVQFALMEVDTFGDRSQLSTLLIRQPAKNFDWNSALHEIEWRVIKEHLKWPTTYIEANFPANAVQRIPHPKTSSGDKTFLEADSVQHWADRILARMQ